MRYIRDVKIEYKKRLIPAKLYSTKKDFVLSFDVETFIPKTTLSLKIS